MTSLFRRLLHIVSLVTLMLGIGTIGFHLITGKPYLDCLYISVYSLSTVGYSDPAPESASGKAFVIIYLLCGAGTYMYLIASIGRWLISDQLLEVLEHRKMEQAIQNMSEHLIVCGCGQMGEMICGQLASQGRPFIVIERSAERIKDLCQPEGWISIHGDATDDEVLAHAGIDRAAGLTAVLSSDADNLYVVMSARMAETSLPIIARASEESAARKLTNAGATHVINPYHAGAVRMARLMMYRGIENLLEIVDGHHDDLELAELPVHPNGPLDGMAIKDSPLPQRALTVIAIRHPDATRTMPVSGNDPLTAGDTVLVVGQQEAIQAFADEL